MRGGRGRGRGGRGGGRGSMTQDLLRDNLEDMGMDLYSGGVMDNMPPPLYPQISLQPPLALSDDDIAQVKKLRELANRFHVSPFHLVEKKQDKDIARYSDKYRMNGLQISILSYISDDKVDMTKYIPEDLFNMKDVLGKSKQRKKRKLGGGEDDILGKGLNRLEQQEGGGGGTRVDGKEKEGVAEDGSDVENELDPGEGDLEDDYGVDHYASDDGFGGSDGEEAEAVF